MENNDKDNIVKSSLLKNDPENAKKE